MGLIIMSSYSFIPGNQVDRESPKFQIQWKPLNVITFVQGQIDNINRMITIAETKGFPENMKTKE